MIFIRNVIKKIHPAWWAVLSITLIGAYPRLYYAGSADFPLNDGGMFLTMIHDLEKSHYAIPMSASYNSAQIPFAYPPWLFFWFPSFPAFSTSPFRIFSGCCRPS
jgi:hypothetical protein